MEATLKIECKDPETIKKSLLPDIKNREDLKVQIDINKKNLIIKIHAEKLSYLKATINSYISLIKMLKEMER